MIRDDGKKKVIKMLLIAAVFVLAVSSAPVPPKALTSALLLGYSGVSSGFSIIPPKSFQTTRSNAVQPLAQQFSRVSELNAQTPNSVEASTPAPNPFNLPFKYEDDYLTNMAKLYIKHRPYLDMKVTITHKDAFDEESTTLVFLELTVIAGLFFDGTGPRDQSR
jgi:hypothetical protein